MAGFGAVLRRMRIAAARAQEAVAECAGLSLRGISDLERGAPRAAPGHGRDAGRRPRTNPRGSAGSGFPATFGSRVMLSKAKHLGRRPRPFAENEILRPPGSE